MRSFLIRVWQWGVSQNWMTWIGHGLAASLLMLPFALTGNPGTGWWVGVVTYAYREADQSLFGWLDHGSNPFSRGQIMDHVMDVLFPIFFCTIQYGIVLL